ncbi:MAG TPA: methyltransferase domain-containing protein [Polyangiaceae bacterium]|jgi:ubiquinone/menaquinone biosynthesis C-methylase UbiE
MVARGLFERATRRFAAHGARAPLGLLLKNIRRRVAESTIQRYQSTTLKFADALERGEHSARMQLRTLADRALEEMRTTVEEEAGRAGFPRSWAASVDDWWRHTSEGEYLDDPSLDQHLRVRILRDLDAMNDLFGSYFIFFTRLRPLAQSDRPTRILDLAAGHGGFALAVAKLGAGAGLELELTASDIKGEYLALGEPRAQELGLGVKFVVQDALDLSNVDRRSYDVVVCVQSLHHFSAGQVAVMFAEAARVASRGVLFIDGARSALNAAMVTGVGLCVYRNRALAHDIMVSFRRFFVPEELEVLARLGRWGSRATAEFSPPGHCVLELRKD